MQYLSLQQGADKVLRLTQHMLQLASTDDWQSVASVEQERQRSIDALFRHPQLAQAMPEIAGTLQKVIELDKLCMARGDVMRQQLALELKAISQGPRALRAYTEKP